ncbi:MAG TPA: hypothetical protein VGE59_02140 [Patescibacteria group bacterium]
MARIIHVREVTRDQVSKVAGFLVRLPDGSEREITVKEVSNPVSYDADNVLEVTPEPFISLVTRTWPNRSVGYYSQRFVATRWKAGSSTTYTVGDEVFFLNEAEVCSLTGHISVVCLGRIQMIDEQGSLYVGFIANPDTSPTRWFLKCRAEELMVVAKREPLGTYGLKLEVKGLYGEAIVEIPLGEPPSAPR